MGAYKCTVLLLVSLLVIPSQAATTAPVTPTVPAPVVPAPVVPAPVVPAPVTPTVPVKVPVTPTAPVVNPPAAPSVNPPATVPVTPANPAASTPVTGATPAPTPAATDSLGNTVTPTTGALSALTVVLRIAGNDVWPFDNTKIAALTQALAATMTSITASDVNTLSAVQTASNSSRRLLASSSADVTTQLDAGSTNAVTTVATDLNRVATDGSLVAKLSSNGVRASGVTVLSAVAAEKVSSSSCNNGAINGICIGKSTRNGIGSGAMIAIAVVGGIVVLVLATIVFCCCRARWRNRASAIEAATLAKSQPKDEPMTPTGPLPFAVNYPQFQGQKSLPRSGSYIPPRTISKGKSGMGGTNMTASTIPPTVKE